MTPDPTILSGDVRAVLATLPEDHFQAAVTSPPYWALRSYLPAGHPLKVLEMGSEPDPNTYVANMVGVFAAVRRVLREDGLVFCNLGDTYNAYNGNRGDTGSTLEGRRQHVVGRPEPEAGSGVTAPGLKPLDRVGIPERFVLAMQRDGWYWRDSIIWCKPAPMPSSANGTRWERCRVKVKAQRRDSSTKMGGSRETRPSPPHPGNGVKMDNAVYAECPGCPKCEATGGYVLRRGSWRTTTAHELVFMFAKSESYFADPIGGKEAALYGRTDHAGEWVSGAANGDGHRSAAGTIHRERSDTAIRNCRSWWVIGPQPLKAKHYASFPEELPAKCLRAAISVKGCCPACGAAWARVVENTPMVIARSDWGERSGNRTATSGAMVSPPDSRTLGWRPTCACPPADPVPCRVLDPFAGSGRTLIAAAKLGCAATGIELNPEYVKLAREEIAAALRPSTARTTKAIPAPLFAQEPDPQPAPAELF